MANKVVRDDFDSVYGDHFAIVRNYVFHFVQNAAVAEDLAQEAFLKALTAWDSFRGETPRRIWLLRIARNVCIDYLRSPRSRSDSAGSLDAAMDDGGEVDSAVSFPGQEPAPSLDQAAEQSEMTACVQDFIRGLPESLRTPLVLHDMQGLTNDEIARVLGCSLDAAKMRLHRARRGLRHMMEQRCDLFRDQRNVLACLPAPPELPGDHSSRLPEALSSSSVRNAPGP